MSNRTVAQIVDREFLEMRSKILDLAASFDRIARASGAPDPRLELIRKGLVVAGDDEGDKAPRIQQLFSRGYSDQWRNELGV